MGVVWFSCPTRIDRHILYLFVASFEVGRSGWWPLLHCQDGGRCCTNSSTIQVAFHHAVRSVNMTSPSSSLLTRARARDTAVVTRCVTAIYTLCARDLSCGGLSHRPRGQTARSTPQLDTRSPRAAGSAIATTPTDSREMTPSPRAPPFVSIGTPPSSLT